MREAAFINSCRRNVALSINKFWMNTFIIRITSPMAKLLKLKMIMANSYVYFCFIEVELSRSRECMRVQFESRGNDGVSRRHNLFQTGEIVTNTRTK